MSGAEELVLRAGLHTLPVGAADVARCDPQVPSWEHPQVCCLENKTTKPFPCCSFQECGRGRANPTYWISLLPGVTTPWVWVPEVTLGQSWN